MNLRIITATRGESPYWQETVDSVARAAPAAEHVVVCPESRIPAMMAARPAHLHAIAESAPGLYPKLNQGVRQPTGPWDAFTWINDDDRLCAPGFGQLCEAFLRQPEIDILYGRVDLIDRHSRRIGELPVARRPADLPALFAADVIPLAQPGTIIRRGIFERLGGLDESYRIVGDMDFFARALALGARFAFTNAVVAEFRLVAGQLSKHREEVAAETSRALAPLAGTPVSSAARLRFRFANLGSYFERVRRHGWISMRDLYDRTA